MMAQGWQWTPDADFGRLRTALLRQGEPDRVPLHDSVDILVKRRFLEPTVRDRHSGAFNLGQSFRFVKARFLPASCRPKRGLTAGRFFPHSGRELRGL